MTQADDLAVRLAYVTDAQRAMEMLATQLYMSNDKGTYHIWQEVRNVEGTLAYVKQLIQSHHDELASTHG